MVEVRGVEPRSEEKILKTSTYISDPLDSQKETPAGWICPLLAQVLPLPGFTSLPCAQSDASPSESTFPGHPMGETTWKRDA